MATYEVSASGVSAYKVKMNVTRSGTTVTVKAQWRRDSYGYSSYSSYATWHIRIDGTDWDGTWDFSGPAGGSISTRTIATRSKNVGWNGSTDVQVWVDFDVSPGSGHINKQIDVSTTPGKAPTPNVSLSYPNTLSASWGAADGRGDSVDKYEISRADNSSFSGDASATTTNRSYTFTGSITLGKTWYVRVRAHNSNGWGAWSNADHVYVPNRPTSSRPSLSFSAPTTLNASWSAADGDGRPILEYQLQVDDNSSFSSPSTVSTGTSRSYSITGASRDKTWYVRVRARTSQGWGGWSSAASYSVPGVPNAVGTPSVSSPTTMSAKVSWSAPGNNGASISGYQIQWNTSQSTSGATTESQGTSTSRTLSGLTPGTGYYVRVRAQNSQGWGGWSGWRAFTTLPAVAPGMTVVAAANGRSAKVTLTPPGGSSGVTKYQIQRRVGTGSATTLTTTTSPYTALSLTPGTTYQWRASAFFGGYQSPWTDWVSIHQPKPNVNPGDYFDGSSEDTDDVTYAWSGTVNNSTSTATGKAPLGWTSGGSTAVVARVSNPIAVYPDGSAAGTYGTQATFLADRTEAGFVLGQRAEASYYSEVSEGGLYTASIYVLPSREQSLAPQITWLDGTGAVMDVVVGDPVIAGSDDPTRLILSAESPTGAVYAAVGAVDVEGDGWSVWLAGETLTADGAMISLEATPYFDGSAPDSTLFAYDWTGAANASTSTRTPLEQATTDPLADPDCATVPAPPVPPVIDSDCIDEVGVWRRYFVIIPDDQVGIWATTLPELRLTTGGFAERQIRIRVYANPDNLSVGSVDTSTWEAESIVSYLPANTTLTLDSVSERAWAVVGDSDESIPADRLLYGTGGVPPTWPTLKCGTAYLISLDTPLDSPAGNLSAEVFLTDRVI